MTTAASAAATAAAVAAVQANAAIMQQLSDIKVAQGKNDTEIKNIGVTVIEIKSDVKDIKKLYVTHDELNAYMKNIDAIDRDHEKRLRWSEGMLKYGLGFVAAIEFGIMIYLALKH